MGVGWVRRIPSCEEPRSELLFLPAEGVDPGAVDEEIPVEVVAGGEAGGADGTDLLAGGDGAVWFDEDFGEVVEAGVEAEAVVDDDGAAADVELLGDDDGAGGGGVDGGATVSAVIDTFVVGAVGAAVVGAAGAVEGAVL